MTKKRISAAIIACVMWITCVIPTLTACKKTSDNYTAGEWLDKVEESFNLLYYTQSEPYFSNINENNEYYSVAQTAAEWGIVDPAEGLKLNKPVTKEFCADTLVKAMNFSYDAAVEITDESKLTHPETAKIAVNEGVFELDSAGKFSPAKKLTKQEADLALLIARDRWVNLTYDESYDNSVVKEGVINLGGVSEEKAPVAAAEDTFKVSYSTPVQLFDESGLYTAQNASSIITFDEGTMPADIKEGSYIILPPDDTVPTSHAVKVESITQNADGTVTVKTVSAELMEVYENLDIQQSETVDFSNAAFFDPNGNRIETHDTQAEDMAYFGEADSRSPAAAIQPLCTEQLGANKSRSGEIDFGGGFKVKFQYKDQKLNITAELSDGNSKMTFTKQIPRINIDAKIDAHWEWDWFNSGIRIDTARGVITYDDSASLKYSIDASKSFTSEGGTAQVSESLEDAYRRASAIYDAIRGFGKASAGKASCQLLKIIIPTGTGIDAQLIVRLNLTLNGEVSISIETSSRFGGELVNGQIRGINEFHQEKSAEFSGKAEATVFLGVGISALGCTAIDAGVNAGLGVKVNIKARRTDSATGFVVEEMALPFGCGSMVKFTGADGISATPTTITLSEDTEKHICADAKIYPVINIEVCTSNSLAGKIFGGIKLSVLSDKNSLYHKHFEFEDGLQILDECSFEEDDGDGIDVEVGPELKLNDEKVLIAVDSDSDYLNLEMIPKGYKLKDLSISVEDESIAKAVLDTGESSKTNGVDLNPRISVETTFKIPFGSFSANNTTELYYKSNSVVKKNLIKIYGVADGVTMCTLSTKDGKHSVQAKIVVGNGGLGNAVSGSLIPSQYSYTITSGGTADISLSAFPSGYDASMLTYSSADPAVASVSASGRITGAADGSTIVTISTTDGKYTALVQVIVDNGSAGNSGGGGRGSAGNSGGAAAGGGSGGGGRAFL